MQLKNRQSGLTLIELSIALTVIGLLTLAFLQFFSIQQAKKQAELQENKFFTITDGLARFVSENGYYPCPARRDRATTVSDFGDATDCLIKTDVNPASPPTTYTTQVATHGYEVTTRGGERIRIGSIPYKAIGIGPEDAIDVYGNQFTYAVVEELAIDLPKYEAFKPTDPSTDGRKIEVHHVDLKDCHPVTHVCETVGYDPKPAQFVLFSHGENGAGSYTSLGTLNPEPCAAGIGSESENCDNDATFATEEYLARWGGGGAGTPAATIGLPDDQLIFNTLNWVYIWDTPVSNDEDIYNRGKGNMSVGLGGNTPASEKLHVIGNIRVEAETVGGSPDEDNGGKVQTTKICDQTSAGCFEPAVIGATDPADPRRLQCPDGQVMQQIKNGAAECRSVLLDTNYDCEATYGPFHYADGFTLNPVTKTLELDCKFYF